MKKVSKILEENSLYPTKSLGQNFLTDQNIIQKIVQTSNISHDVVLEVGPGLGHLTEKLLIDSQLLVAVEIDKKLIPVLKEKFSYAKNLQIINADFLSLKLDQIFNAQVQKQQKIIVVANLPYYLTSPILLKLFDYLHLFKRLVLMMQKEVALRLVAKPGTKQYSNLSIMAQYYCDLKIAFDVKPQSFFPVPKVTSSVLQFEIKSNLTINPDQPLIWKFIRQCFSSKRKTLINNLAKLIDKTVAIEILKSFSWDLNLRAETMTYVMFLQLYQAISKLKK